MVKVILIDSQDSCTNSKVGFILAISVQMNKGTLYEKSAQIHTYLQMLYHFSQLFYEFAQTLLV